MQRKDAPELTSPPGELADCQERDPEKREIFIEGERGNWVLIPRNKIVCG